MVHDMPKKSRIMYIIPVLAVIVLMTISVFALNYDARQLSIFSDDIQNIVLFGDAIYSFVIICEIVCLCTACIQIVQSSSSSILLMIWTILMVVAAIPICFVLYAGANDVDAMYILLAAAIICDIYVCCLYLIRKRHLIAGRVGV